MNTSTASHQTPTYEDVMSRLRAVGQEHVLAFYRELPEAYRHSLLNQAASLDLENLPSLVQEYVLNKPKFELPYDLQPAPYYPGHDPSKGRPWDVDGNAKSLGEELLNKGRVAAFVVAGGQGSRLGYDGPKGCYPAGAVTKKSLFQMFADQLLAAEARYGHPIPWYIMTSPLNHAATLHFFEQELYFGLQASNVMFFPQGTLPSLDIRTGKMLMSSKHEIATNPDGHGGSLKALWQSGALDDMKRRNIEHISYFQVDNPIVKIIDPLFIGLHADTSGAWEGRARSSGEMSSKMIPKAYPEEKLGIFCAVPFDGGKIGEPSYGGTGGGGGGGGGARVEIIEYSDLPKELQAQRLADGTLRFLCGSIAVHMLGVNFVERVNTNKSFDLPYHRAEKKIPCINVATGEPIEPSQNNGVKLERFVFDALPMCDWRASMIWGVPSSLVMQADRIEEFAPIKNATGIDSVESSREIQTERAARWLEAAGVKIPRKPDGKPDCVLEIDPRTTFEAADLKGRELPEEIRAGESRVI